MVPKLNSFPKAWSLEMKALNTSNKERDILSEDCDFLEHEGHLADCLKSPREEPSSLVETREVREVGIN